MLDIKATSSTPSITWDGECRVLSISGESYPENSFVFFAPVFEWLARELEGLGPLCLQVEVSYMNSSSTKCVLDILDLLCEAAEKGADMRVVWLYEAGNERALDLAEEFREDVKIPFEIRPLERGAT
jgi:hypothetical protein